MLIVFIYRAKKMYPNLFHTRTQGDMFDLDKKQIDGRSIIHLSIRVNIRR